MHRVGRYGKGATNEERQEREEVKNWGGEASKKGEGVKRRICATYWTDIFSFFVYCSEGIKRRKRLFRPPERAVSVSPFFFLFPFLFFVLFFFSIFVLSFLPCIVFSVLFFFFFIFSLLYFSSLFCSSSLFLSLSRDLLEWAWATKWKCFRIVCLRCRSSKMEKESKAGR